MTFEELESILKDIKYKHWIIKARHVMLNTANVTIEFTGLCNFTHKPITIQTIATMHLDMYKTTDIVHIIKHRIVNMEVHEALENFLYKGEALFNPHIKAIK